MLALAAAEDEDADAVQECRTAEDNTSSLGVWQLPLQLATYPRIFMVDNLFSAAECDDLVHTAVARGMRNVKLMGADGRPKRNADSRKSLTTEFERELPELKAWRERMAGLALMPESHGEPLAVTQYMGGQGHKYELHFDSSLHVGRIATVIVFLSDVHHGGELMFPWARTTASSDSSLRPEGVSGQGLPISQLVGVTKEPPIEPMCQIADHDALKIAPRRGRAVVFFTHAPDLRRYGYRAMHAGCPPTKLGEDKWIAQLFIKWHDLEEPNVIEHYMNALREDWMLPLHE